MNLPRAPERLINCDINALSTFVSWIPKSVTDYDKWKEAMDSEYNSLIKNGSWVLESRRLQMGIQTKV